MNVVKFLFDEKEGYFSVIEEGSSLYTLAEVATPKVDFAKEHGTLEISYVLKNSVYTTKQVKVHTDIDIVTEYYNKLKDAGNLYFDQLDESLCVIEIIK